MKIVRGILVAIIGIILVITASLYLTGNDFLLTAINRTYLSGYKTANINDHRVFERNIIKTGKTQPLEKHESYNKQALPAELLEELNKLNTAAFLILHKKQLISEHYLNGYDDRSKTNSFSMAKTVLTMLLGIAIQEGHIESLEQPVTDFLPEFKNDPLAKQATIGHLIMMNSGYEWDEHYYSPLSPVAELYYGDNVSNFLGNGYFSEKAGEFWEYSSASTQLAGIFIARALNKGGAANNLSDYLSRKLWQPLGMNDNGVWHSDAQGMELTFCCLNTNARNYAKLGLLMLNQGEWEGTQLVPAKFIEHMLSPVASETYGLSTWLSYEQEPKLHWFSGHLGQYIVNVPEHDLTIVRLGEKSSPNVNPHTIQTISNYLRKYYLDYALTLIEEH